MAKSLTKEDAEIARATAETWKMVKSSLLGDRLEKELVQIEEQAINGALRGDTPESTNVIFERRGEYRAVQRIRKIFKEVEKEEADAVLWQTSNVPDASAKQG